MIKSVNQLVTERCNSRCKMCSIWKLRNRCYEMTPKEVDIFYSKPEFSDVEDLCISGGEPTLRKDLLELTDNIIKHLPKLRMLFLSTNGSNPELARDFVTRYASRVKDIYICPSLEGDRNVHKKIRGVDTYYTVIRTVKLIKQLNLKNCHVVFSTTIVPENCNKKSLDHIRKLAREFESDFSFRLACQNDTFYHNRRGDAFLINDKQLKFLIEYIRTSGITDPFLDILYYSLDGKETIMGSRKNGIKCLAGDISVFIKSNGDIYPCINSSRHIGDKERGVFNYNYALGNKELCPCCTECQIYPMLNFSKFSSRRKIGKSYHL